MVACSGGPDSLALAHWTLRYCQSRSLTLAVAHVDHGLRGPASRGDAAFVRRWARVHRTKAVVERVPVKTFSQRSGLGLEAAGRQLRYRSLAKMARSQRCPVVLTAHTLDDQVETFFLHLLRGAGPSGLSAMAPQSSWPVGPGPRLLRPLLGFRKADLIKVLHQSNLTPRLDASNRDPAFLRNRLRPVLRQWDRLRPGFFDRLGRLCDLVRDEEEFWREALPRGVCRRSGQTVILDRLKFIKYHRAIQRRLLRTFVGQKDFFSLERARQFIIHDTPKRLSLPSGEALREGRRVIFLPAQKARERKR